MTEVWLPKGYPNRLSDSEIENKIEEIQSYISNSRVRDLLSGHIAAMDSGLAELERRRARKTTRWALWLSGASMFFALGAITFSFLDFIGDKSWQKEQIEVLESINRSINLQLVQWLRE